jgi:hypothetical protein
MEEMMDEEWYEFDNEWTMRRESVQPFNWILQDEKGRKIDRDKYRHDMIGRHKLIVAKHEGGL